MEIYEKIDCKNIFELGFEDNYFKSDSIYLKFYDDSVVIKELDNSMKRGKVCRQFSIYNNGFERNRFKVEFANWLSDNALSIKDFIVLLKNDSVISDFYNNFSVNTTELKGVRVFSPFADIKPIKTPKKWTLPHVAKAILSGQIDSGKCDGKYTDDYAYDAAYNFQKGNIKVMSLAKKIIETPSGWRVHVDKEKNNIIQLSVNCHHFNYNTLYFKKK